MKMIVDIVKKGVISKTGTALPAVRRGTRQTFARHIFVSKLGFSFQKHYLCKYVTFEFLTAR